MKICEAIGCSWPVFGGGYCRNHQYLRKDKKLKRLKYKSEKRKREEKEYKRICNELDAEAKAAGRWVCFFCDGELGYTCTHHHLRKRGKFYLAKDFIVLVHALCHNKYHASSQKELAKETWYEDFLIRLKKKDEILYNKELNKKLKS